MKSITRKPVPGAVVHPSGLDAKQPSIKKERSPMNTKMDIEHDAPPSYDSLDDTPLVEGETCPDLDEQLEQLELETGDLAVEAELPDVLAETLPTSPGSPDPDSSSWKKAIGVAFDEVKHFAGGLMSHPYEATKHYAVLRHSLGIVYYQGPETSVAITVFSDQPLPADRKLWLQKRGFSGSAGLKIGATLGSRSAWIDVTPAFEAKVQALRPADERAWQRDIAKFEKKTRDAKNIKNQRACETDIVRIPHVADDGYFRIVLCADRKVLCPSPVFRYASTSTSPAKLRGASLTTLPLEIGVKVGAWAAHSTTSTYMSKLASPITSALPSALTGTAASTAYDVVGAASKVDKTVQSTDAQYDQKLAQEYEHASGSTIVGVEVVGEEEGPVKPYPITFSSRATRATDESGGQTKTVIMNLSSVREDVLLRLAGVYISWVCLERNENSGTPELPESVYDWQQAIVTVEPLRDSIAKVVERKIISIVIMNDEFEGITLPEVKLNVMLMAYLRPYSPLPPADVDSQRVADMVITQVSLDRPAWGPDMTLERIKSEASQRSFTQRVADARGSGQRQINRVPLHRLGIRTSGMGLKDRLIGNGGICVRR